MKITEEKQPGSPTDHLANERTFLAWIRTGIAIMAFGFVVVKFSLFVRQISLLLGREAGRQPHGHSDTIGILLVATGSLTVLLSYFHFKRTERQLTDGVYKHSSVLMGLIMMVVCCASIFLIIYLIESI